jgi:hypothetical protein
LAYGLRRLWMRSRRRQHEPRLFCKIHPEGVQNVPVGTSGTFRAKPKRPWLRRDERSLPARWR